MYTNLTAYPGLGFRHYIHGNRLHHCLILQATWSLVRRGRGWVLEPLEEQPALVMADVSRPVLALPAGDLPGADARAHEQVSSLRAASELVPFKPHADVLVQGDAIAPDGHPASQWLAGIRVGNWRKMLRVSGPRRWEYDTSGKAWRLSAPEPVDRVPLIYEYAYGGTVLSARGDPLAYDANPCGVGFLGRPPMAPPGAPLHIPPSASLPVAPGASLPVPSIEYPDEQTPEQPGHVQRVAGFGPIPMHWAPRNGLLGTVDIAAIRRNGPAYPDDFDPAYWQTAPSDQWLPWLRGGQEVELFNLIEGEPSVRFALPSWLGFAAVRKGEHTRYPDMNIDTLEVDAHQRTVRMVWRLAVPHAVDHPEWIGMQLAIPEVLYPGQEAAPPQAPPASQEARWRAASARDKGGA